jgi:hypothetical protein
MDSVVGFMEGGGYNVIRNPVAGEGCPIGDGSSNDDELGGTVVGCGTGDGAAPSRLAEGREAILTIVKLL